MKKRCEEVGAKIRKRTEEQSLNMTETPQWLAMIRVDNVAVVEFSQGVCYVFIIATMCILDRL